MLNTRIEYRPVKQVEYDGEWYDAFNVARGIFEILDDVDCGEDSSWSDGLRRDDIDLPLKLIKAFVANGLLSSSPGERMSTRYRIAEGKRETLRDMAREMYDFCMNRPTRI